jgi:hypothetical protein
LQEYDALVNNPAVTAIYQINVHLSNEDQPQLLWPSQTPANVETLLVSPMIFLFFCLIKPSHFVHRQESTVAVSCSVFSPAGLW